MQIYLPERLFSDLKRSAKIQDTSMSEIIRTGLQKVLYQKKSKETRFDPMRDFVGRCTSRDKTDSIQEVHSLYKKGGQE